MFIKKLALFGPCPDFMGAMAPSIPPPASYTPDLILDFATYSLFYKHFICACSFVTPL